MTAEAADGTGAACAAIGLGNDELVVWSVSASRRAFASALTGATSTLLGRMGLAPAPDALLRWFQGQRREARDDDAVQLRLESDRNLVQIVTVHKAKGLEYPVVFCPFVANGRAGGGGPSLDGVEYHDDGGRAAIDFRKDFEGEFDEKLVARGRKLEADAESLRLVYVALTRAVHRCIIVAGSYGAGKGNSTAESGRSLLNWLVAGAGLSPDAWFEHRKATAEIEAAWNALASRCAPQVGVAPLPAGPWVTLEGERVSPEMLAALPAPAHPFM